MSPDPARRERVIAADRSASDDAESRILSALETAATALDATEESLVVARRHMLPEEPTLRELLAETHGAATLGVFLLSRGEDPLAFPTHPESVEQDCYDATVKALGFDPLEAA